MTTGIASIAWRRVVVLAELSFGFKLVVYEGVAARLAGIALIALGVAVASLGAAHATGTSAAAIRSSMIARPGLLLAPLGFPMLLAGLAYVVGFAEDLETGAGPVWNPLLSIPQRLGGVVLAVIGGARRARRLELLAPQAFDGLVESFRRPGSLELAGIHPLAARRQEQPAGSLTKQVRVRGAVTGGGEQAVIALS